MEFEDQVEELYADTDVHRMLSLSATAAPLRICYPKEINVSRFLAWLMDPEEGHGLGDLPLRSLLAHAGQTDRAQDLPINDRRFLSAASVYTQSFSSVVVSTEVDVGTTSKKLLDVLIFDPFAGLYIAIENKFGAKEGADQTKEYRKGLKNLFPSYRGIHIYLDSSEAEPKDESWLPVGYAWLAELLKLTEQRESIAPHVREALAQFRSIIEDEDEESAARSTLGTLISQVAGKHSDVLEAMRLLVRPHARTQRAKELFEIMKQGGATNRAKAETRLFHLYCRRPVLWDRCFKQTLFGSFKNALGEKFNDLDVDQRRVITTFSLREWERLVDPGKEYLSYIAGINVSYADDKYGVRSYINFADVRPDRRAAILSSANEMRAQIGLRPGREESGWLNLKRVDGMTSSDAAVEAIEQLLALKQVLDQIR
ncbi:PDDEXK-like family protein [Comamonas sp. MYb69]|uniref:PDDEXK-like family protein n=1 Tax=Comamonas sp. MYb69 TaxID=1848650 RepID=UPI00309542E4